MYGVVMAAMAATAALAPTRPWLPLARVLALILLPILLIGGGAAAAAGADGERPTVALVLGGGSARGFSHIGLLKALAEAGIPVDMLVGTSMGSLVAGMYAAGLSVDNLVYVATTIDMGQLFEPLAPSRGGLVDPRRLQIFIDHLTGGATFDRLTVPFYAVLTHLETGQEVVWSQGPISRGILASIAIPGTFPPVELEGEYYVDGGVASMVPVEAARRLGADVIIAVDVRGKRTQPVDPTDPLDVLNTVLDHMLGANADAQLAQADVVVFPDIPADAGLEYDRAADFIAAGYAAAQEALPQIRAALLAKDPNFPFGIKPPPPGWPDAEFAQRVSDALNAATADVPVLQLSALPAYRLGVDGAIRQLGFDLDLGHVKGQPLYGLYSLRVTDRTVVHTLGIGAGTCRGLCGAAFLRRDSAHAHWSPGLLLEGVAQHVHYAVEWEARATETGPGWQAELMYPLTSEALVRGHQLVVEVSRDPRGIYGPGRDAVRAEARIRWYLPAERRTALGFLRGATHWYFGAGLAQTWDGSSPPSPLVEAGAVLNEYVFGLHPVRLRAAVTYRGDESWSLLLALGE
ncbi:MAG TPA: patatin-like phospholipase family protein [Limnochordales bacterium]|nr:patatin-like phospholipase family protein [Limnochordales bacterium]